VRALIGSTGFVGGNLLRQMQFTDLYSSVNIGQISGRTLELIVCAGAPGTKWIANTHPIKDRRSIDKLMAALDGVRGSPIVILISTVDVYGEPRAVDENTAPYAADDYGENRAGLELFVATRFERYRIYRLPALFGEGLKKNALFDLMHGKNTCQISPNAIYQWYPVERLWRDILTIRHRVVNLATEPITMAAIRDSFFRDIELGPPSNDPLRYDVRSIYAANGYHLQRDEVLTEMEKFLADA